MMEFNEYALKARFAPSLITIILPIMVFNHFYVSPEFASFVGEVTGVTIVSNLTISVICLYYLSELGRFFGKNIFEKYYYKEESYMPTTNFLMHADMTFSSEYKEKFGKKVHTDFGFTLPSVNDQRLNEIDARIRIVEVMALIRKKLSENRFLLQHNIEYGAIRNAIGGAVVGTIFCLLNLGFFTVLVPSKIATHISISLLLIYGVLIAASKAIMDFYGRNYAKVLFREFMGME